MSISISKPCLNPFIGALNRVSRTLNLWKLPSQRLPSQSCNSRVQAPEDMMTLRFCIGILYHHGWGQSTTYLRPWTLWFIIADKVGPSTYFFDFGFWGTRDLAPAGITLHFTISRAGDCRETELLAAADQLLSSMHVRVPLPLVIRCTGSKYERTKTCPTQEH